MSDNNAMLFYYFVEYIISSPGKNKTLPLGLSSLKPIGSKRVKNQR
jgi:hypothetical protein